MKTYLNQHISLKYINSVKNINAKNLHPPPQFLKTSYFKLNCRQKLTFQQSGRKKFSRGDHGHTLES